MPSDEPPTETSPLLGHAQNGDVLRKVDSISTDGGIATDGIDASADLERRESLNASRAAQFQGAPEIQARMKYILPAISIGVC
jgi:hypothetical protein